MSDVGGQAWNRTLMENGSMLVADYVSRFRHLRNIKGKVYYRGALIHRQFQL
jgi:hypothetical protein